MKTTLVIAHGWAYSIKPWTKTVADLQARGIEVKQLQVPGLTTPSSEVWTIDGYTAWLAQQLQGIENPIVLGHSNGGRIALNYLAQGHDNAFAGLILLNAAGVYENPGAVSFKRRVFRAAAKALAPLKHVPYLKKIVYRLLKSDYNRAPENMKKTLHNMLESDKALDLSRVHQDNIFVVWGEDDKVTPLGMGKKMHQQLAGSQMSTFAGWPHAPYITHPEQLAEEIARIVQQIEAQPSREGAGR